MGKPNGIAQRDLDRSRTALLATMDGLHQRQEALLVQGRVEETPTQWRIVAQQI